MTDPTIALDGTTMIREPIRLDRVSMTATATTPTFGFRCLSLALDGSTFNPRGS